jgi:predicted transcriptional regulator
MFTKISTEAVDDPRLSAAALGVLVWLLRQPSTEGVTIKKITENMHGTGLTAVSKSVSQLEELGYLERVQVHRNGRYQPGLYIVTDRPNAA